MLYIALDIGTTTIKAAIFNEAGELIDSRERQSKLYTPEAGFREHDPDEVVTACLDLLKEIIDGRSSAEFGFLALSSYMHSLILVDEAGKPLTNCLLWNDARSSAIAKELKNSELGDQLYHLTGTPIHPMSPLCKLRYFKENAPELLAQAAKLASIKEYLVYKISGEWLSEYSSASGTGLFDQAQLKWSSEALSYAGIEAEQLPKPVSVLTQLRWQKPEFLAAVGLDKPLTIVLGAGDGPLANLGSRGLEPGSCICTIGTSAAVRVVSRELRLDSQGRIFSYILNPELNVAGGALNNGGIAYDWLRHSLGFDQHIDELISHLSPPEDERVGAGLIFLPFLSGERAPYWDAKLRASFIGLSQEHDSLDLMVAGLRGICFAIRDVFDVLVEATGEDVNAIYANGGFCHSKYWLQLLADVLEKAVITLQGGGGPLFGAYLIGLQAIGKLANQRAAAQYFVVEERFEPRIRESLRENYKLYKRAISLNQELMHELSELQAQASNWLLRAK